MFHELASNVAKLGKYVSVYEKGNLEEPVTIRPPLLPLLLALFYFVFGAKPLVAQIVLSLIGSFVPIVAFLLARFFLSNPVLCAVLCIFHPFFILLGAIPLTESIQVLLFPLNLYLMLLIESESGDANIKKSIILGLVLGLNLLAKPTAQIFFPMILIFLILEIRNSKEVLKLFSLICFVALITVSPWIVRNYLATGRFIFITDQFWILFYLGSGPYAEYTVKTFLAGKEGIYHSPVYREEFSKLTEEERQKKYKEVLGYIISKPFEFLRLSLIKLKIFFSAYSNIIHRIWWNFILLTFIPGLLLLRAKKSYLLLLTYAFYLLGPIFFVSLPRHRAPIEVLILIFSSKSVEKISQYILNALKNK